ncbi:protein NO VEIN domain-containing protein [Photobacterium damselae]
MEVKTTKQSANTAFFISRNEVQVSRDKGNQY